MLKSRVRRFYEVIWNAHDPDALASVLHRRPSPGYAPTGKRLSRIGGALFTFDGDRVADLWLPGDLKGLDELLRNQREADPGKG